MVRVTRMVLEGFVAESETAVVAMAVPATVTVVLARGLQDRVVGTSEGYAPGVINQVTARLILPPSQNEIASAGTSGISSAETRESSRTCSDW